MPCNVEIKARVPDLAAMTGRVAPLATSGPFTLRQRDVFFHSPRGRLKLRRIEGQIAELIYYERVGTPDPAASDYLVLPVPDPDLMERLLTAACGARGSVRKERTLFMVEQTRIHLDQVEELGSFLELEVMLGSGDDTAAGDAIARRLMEELHITADMLLAGSYIDMLGT